MNLIEITTATKDELAAAQNWDQQLTYKGTNLFHMLYELAGGCERVIAELFEGLLPSDRQECYVGYIPANKDLDNTDQFIMGFDCEYDADDEYSNIFIFSLDPTAAPAPCHNIEDLESVNNAFYSGNLEQLHAKFPTMIDIRLDW